MTTLLVGLAGTLLGIGLKALFDLFTEKSRRKREDIVWRRQHALDAAASFLEAAQMVQILGRTIEDSSNDSLATKQAGQEAALPDKWNRLETEKAKKRAVLEQANNALSRLSLLLEQETYLQASKYLGAVVTRPRANIGGQLAHLNNVLRADLGLPARVITPGTGITAEDYSERVESNRRDAAENVGRPDAGEAGSTV